MLIDLTNVFEFFQGIYACIPLPIHRLIGVLAVFTTFIYIRDCFVEKQ